MIARPSLELIRCDYDNQCDQYQDHADGNVESFGVPVIPCGPLMITSPPSMFSDMASFIGKNETICIINKEYDDGCDDHPMPG